MQKRLIDGKKTRIEEIEEKENIQAHEYAKFGVAENCFMHYDGKKPPYFFYKGLNYGTKNKSNAN